MLVGSVNGVLSQAADVGDDRSTAIVYTIVVLLGLIGVALIVVAVWLWRATAPDRRLLAPLELMDDPAWRRQDPQNRRRSLDEVRPDGAQPLVPATQRPNLDDRFDEVAPVSDFDDLTEPVEDPLVIDLGDDEDDGWDELTSTVGDTAPGESSETGDTDDTDDDTDETDDETDDETQSETDDETMTADDDASVAVDGDAGDELVDAADDEPADAADDELDWEASAADALEKSAPAEQPAPTDDTMGIVRPTDDASRRS